MSRDFKAKRRYCLLGTVWTVSSGPNYVPVNKKLLRVIDNGNGLTIVCYKWGGDLEEH